MEKVIIHYLINSNSFYGLTFVVSFVIIHTIKSDSDRPSSLIVCSSFKILPACISFCLSAIKSDLVS